MHAYKHINTRGYIHLDASGQAWVYEEPDRYRPWDAADVLAAVFRPLIGLSGVTPEQVGASWAAVDRLSTHI